jgi:hypothetical protein
MANNIRAMALGIGLSVGLLASGCSSQETANTSPNSVVHMDPQIAKKAGLIACKTTNDSRYYFKFWPGDTNVNTYLQHVTGIPSATIDNSIMGTAVCDNTITQTRIEEGVAVIVRGDVYTNTGAYKIGQVCAAVGLLDVNPNTNVIEPDKNVAVVCPALVPPIF